MRDIESSENPAWPDSRSFWRGRRVVVTGGAGFLGGFVVERLRARGAAVEDAAAGILLAAERNSGPEPVNLGSSYEISIKDLTETVARATGFRGAIRWDTGKPNGQPRRKLAVSRARELFGFESRVSFEEGLRRTVAWYERQPAPLSLEAAV